MKAKQIDSTAKNVRIGILTNGNYFANNIIKKLIDNYPDQVVAVAITPATGQLKNSRLRNLINVLRHAGLYYFLYKAITYVFFKVIALGDKKRSFFVATTCHQMEINYEYFLNVNSKRCERFLHKAKIDLLVVISVPYLVKQRIANTAKILAVNIHSSKLPAYAGVQTYIWVLANSEQETGISIHELTQEFDEGKIFQQESVVIEKGISVFKLFDTQTRIGGNLLIRLVESLKNDNLSGIQQDITKRSYYSAPSKKEISALRKNGFRLFFWSDFFKAARRKNLKIRKR